MLERLYLKKLKYKSSSNRDIEYQRIDVTIPKEMAKKYKLDDAVFIDIGDIIPLNQKGEPIN